MRMQLLKPLVFMLLLVSALSADLASGLAWLNDRAESNTTSVIALDYQSLSEMILALNKSEDVGALYNLLRLDDLNSTEVLSRKVLVAQTLDDNVQVILQAIKLHENANYAYGEFQNFHETVLDTAYALQAYGAVGLSDEVAISAMVFLRDSQNSDGSWNNANNEPSVFVTAQVLYAFSFYQHVNNFNQTVSSAQNYLITMQQDNGGFGEVFESAQALIALQRTSASKIAIEKALDFLKQTQNSDGSWLNDTYSTALSIRALQLSNQLIANPYVSSISGVVVDSQTQLPLANVYVNLSGTQSRSILTDAEGAFVFNDVVFGVYDIQIQSDGYGAVSTKIEIASSQHLSVGTVALVQNSEAPTVGTIQGVITDKATGEALGGVSVTAADKSAITNGEGTFIITGIEPGEITIRADLSGYYLVSSNGVINAGDTILFSPKLQAQTQQAPEPARVQGRVVDEALTPLVGVNITLQGATTLSVETTLSGEFNISNVPAGSYDVLVSKVGFYALKGSISVQNGTIFDFSNIQLKTVDEAVSTVLVRGVVLDEKSATPLEGVSIQIGDATITTDAQGEYQFDGIEPGDIQIKATLSGYFSSSATTTAVAGQSIIFSPRLRAIPSITFSGVVTDAETQAPIADAQITMSGVNVATVYSDVNGSYVIKPMNLGEVMVTISKEGYDAVTVSKALYEGAQVLFSPQLYPSDTSPTDANTAGIKGIVLDASTNLPIVDAFIEIDTLNGIKSTYSGAEGEFEINGLQDAVVQISVTAVGYKAISYTMPLEPLEVLDLGQVRLRKDEVVQLLPDIYIQNMKKAYTTDPSTLVVSGNLDAIIINGGTATMQNSAIATAFFDVNGNGQYDTFNDKVLGTIAIEQLDVDENQSVSIELNGTLPFRDAAISLMVDSEFNCIELDETNNINSIDSVYKIEPLAITTLDPVLKWHWRTSSYVSSYKQVMSAPIVGQLNDDNGDGKINLDDTPDVIFTTFSSRNYRGYGVLRAVSGKDGAEIISISGTAPSSTPALADIDGDGIIEIIVGGANGQGLYVYENNGDLKWSQAVIGGGHPAIADLDSDGTAEIIFRNTVFDANGAIKWTFQDSTIPIAADLNLDGQQEILAGKNVYDSNGTIIWNYECSGFGTAVGNFDRDDYPEIVCKYDENNIILYEHDGSVKWGPITVPGGGGGPITLSDVDADGKVEIGIAGAYYYVVFEDDGSVKWQSSTRDYSSRATGSTVFDFEGDGKTEILYSDEINFRIYDGETGTVRYELPNPSGTLTEYPLVADIDNDDHAEIILVSNNYTFSGVQGIRTFEDRNDSWMPTRSIWNQHSYHITNINDDGTVPAQEQASWLTHNTYRLNTFLDRDPLSVPDYTLSLVRVIDNGLNQPYSIQARVGNAGSVKSEKTLALSCYDASSIEESRLLGTVTVEPLSTNQFIDVRIDNIAEITNNEITCKVDPLNTIAEYEESNNEMSIAVQAFNVVGMLRVMSDKAEYTVNEIAQFEANVTNLGRLDSALQLHVMIKNSANELVEEFGYFDLGVIASNESVSWYQAWDTENIFAGSYFLMGMILDDKGNIIDQSSSQFNIIFSNIEGISENNASLRLTTDKLRYSTTDTIDTTSFAQNLLANRVLSNTTMQLLMQNENAQVIAMKSISVGEIMPGSFKQVIEPFTYTALPEGNYTIAATLYSGNADVLATDSTQINIQQDTQRALLGDVELAEPTVEKGALQQCSDTLRNIGTSALESLQIRTALLDFATNDIIAYQNRVATLAVDENSTSSWGIVTSGLNEGTYSCAQQILIENEWQTISYANFTVTEPPIAISASYSIGKKGRMLVLVDPQDVKRWCALNFFGKFIFNGSTVGNDDEPYGPVSAPKLSEQEHYLNELLDRLGYAYTVVNSASSFQQELRSGLYNGYLIFSETITLSTQLQKEIREAVYRGEGLLIAGRHDSRNTLLDTIEGIDYRGNITNTVYGLNVSPQMAYESGFLALENGDDDKNKVKDTTATEIATFDIKEGGFFGPFCNSDERAALTYNQYHLGNAVYISFDILMYAAKHSAGSPYETLLTRAIEQLQPTLFEPYVNSVLPVTLTLENQGVATLGQTITSFQNGAAQVVAAPAANVLASGDVLWNYSLAEGNATSLSIWLQLSQSDETLVTMLYTGDANALNYYDTLSFSLPVTSVKTLQSIADAVNGCDSILYANVKLNLDIALLKANYGLYDYALQYAIYASDALALINTEQSRSIRLELALAIKALSQQVQ